MITPPSCSALPSLDAQRVSFFTNFTIYLNCLVNFVSTIWDWKYQEQYISQHAPSFAIFAQEEAGRQEKKAPH